MHRMWLGLLVWLGMSAAWGQTTPVAQSGRTNSSHVLEFVGVTSDVTVTLLPATGFAGDSVASPGARFLLTRANPNARISFGPAPGARIYNLAFEGGFGANIVLEPIAIAVMNPIQCSVAATPTQPAVNSTFTARISCVDGPSIVGTGAQVTGYDYQWNGGAMSPNDRASNDYTMPANGLQRVEVTATPIITFSAAGIANLRQPYPYAAPTASLTVSSPVIGNISELVQIARTSSTYALDLNLASSGNVQITPRRSFPGDSVQTPVIVSLNAGLNRYNLAFGSQPGIREYDFCTIEMAAARACVSTFKSVSIGATNAFGCQIQTLPANPKVGDTVTATANCDTSSANLGPDIGVRQIRYIWLPAGNSQGSAGC